MNRDSFINYHPLANVVFYVVVLFVAMFINHPVYQIISLLGALIYGSVLGIVKLKSLLMMVPTMLMVIMINVLFNHEGATILVYLRNGNPITLESIVFGVSFSIMLLSVLLWFATFNKVIDSDKMSYLLGRFLPNIALLFSLLLRFIPKFNGQMKKTHEAQSQLYGHEKSFVGKIKRSVMVFFITVTWAIEHHIESADSMKSRGYGVGKRTSFSIYQWTLRDFIVLTWTCLSGLILLVSTLSGGMRYSYFPLIMKVELFHYGYAVYGLLVMLPSLIRLYEELEWKYYIQKV